LCAWQVFKVICLLYCNYMSLLLLATRKGGREGGREGGRVERVARS
jgi:hypothetical protein